MDNNAKQHGIFSVIDGGLSQPKTKRTGGGGGDMESRVARLESSVENIQINMSEAKSDIRVLTSDVSDLKTSMALLIQKVDSIAESVSDIKTAVSKLPTSEVIQSRFELIESKVTELSGKVSNQPSEDKINAKFTEVNSKIEVESAKTETKINSARLQVILWVLGGLPAITFGIYRLYLAYKGS
ncbi:hypothetical protein [Providencia huashanensis]|uniref:hypothetical protein n=1 Tax=Providencia huashanensis TaxID=3037798 RepID=UPI00404576F2